MKNSPKFPRKKNSFWKIFVCGFLLSLLPLIIASSYVRFNYNQGIVEQKNCAVVFGAAVWRDDIPSHALFDRTIAAINLYKQKKVSCLIFSGGKSTYGSHEADVMKKIAQKESVNLDNIFIDYEGNNTLKTLENVKQNFAEKSLVFVSNDFHLARIKLIAKKLKINNFALHAAKYNNGKYLKNSYFFWREVSGVLYYFFFL